MAQQRTPYAYPYEGSMQVVGDGPELLVYSGSNDAPMWKAFTDGLIMGVGATRDKVISVDADGRLIVWRAMDGQRINEAEVGARDPRDLRITSDGGVLVLAKDTAWLGDAGGVGTSIAVQGASAIALASKVSAAVGTRKGAVEVYENGAKKGSADVGAAVTGICWLPKGQWAVSAGKRVHFVAGDGSSVVGGIDLGAEAGQLAVSSDGALLAIICGGQTIYVFELGGNRMLGTIQYSREINGIGFGNQAWIGIGLDDGDTNRVDLLTGTLCRNEPQPGRTGNRWGFKVDVDPVQVRAAVANVRAKGGPIAVHIKPPEEDESKGSCWMRGCLITIVLMLICGCSSTICSGLYYFVYLPH